MSQSQITLEESLKRLGGQTTVLGQQNSDSSMMIVVRGYDLTNPGNAAVIGHPVDDPETEMKITLTQDPAMKKNRQKEIINYAQDQEGAQLSVRTQVGGVIRLDALVKQEDGSYTSRFAIRVTPDQSNGVARYMMCHKEMVAYGQRNATQVDARLITSELLKSTDQHEKQLGEVLNQQIMQNKGFTFVNIQELASVIASSMIDQTSNTPVYTAEQASSLLTRLAAKNFVLKDPELAKEYASIAAYRVSVLSPEKAQMVSDASSFRQTLTEFLASPDNAEHIKNSAGGYTPKVMIRATDGNTSQVFEVVAPADQNSQTFAFLPLDKAVNKVMSENPVAGLLNLMQGSEALSRNLQVEMIPAKTYSALQRTKEKMSDYVVSETVKNGYNPSGDKLWAKEYVGMRYFAKYNMLHVVTAMPKNRQSLHATQVTINQLQTDNIRPGVNASVQQSEPTTQQNQNTVQNNYEPQPHTQRNFEQSTVDMPGSEYAPPYQNESFDPNEMEQMQNESSRQPAPRKMSM